MESVLQADRLVQETNLMIRGAFGGGHRGPLINLAP